MYFAFIVCGIYKLYKTFNAINLCVSKPIAYNCFTNFDSGANNQKAIKIIWLKIPRFGTDGVHLKIFSLPRAVDEILL